MKPERRQQVGLLAISLLLVGCTTVVRSEAEFYFQKHPELKSQYARFSPTDADSVEECAYKIYLTRMGMVATRKEEGANAKRIDDMTRMAGQWYGDEHKVAEALRAAAKRTGGQIYKYEIQQVPHGEGGYLVIRDGEIVERIDVSKWTNHE